MLQKTYRVLHSDSGPHGHIEFIKPIGQKIYFSENTKNVDMINGHILNIVSIEQHKDVKTIALPNEIYRLEVDGTTVDARVKLNDGFEYMVTSNGYHYSVKENTIASQKNIDVRVISISDRMGEPIILRTTKLYENGVLIETEDGYSYYIDSDNNIKLVTMRTRNFYRETTTYLQHAMEQDPNAIITNHYTFPPTTPLKTVIKTAKDKKDRGLFIQTHINDMYCTVRYDTEMDIYGQSITLKHRVNNIPVMEQTITFNVTVTNVDVQGEVVLVYMESGGVTVISPEVIKQVVLYSNDMAIIPIYELKATRSDNGDVNIDGMMIEE